MRGYCDGACRVSNPGQCSAAFAVLDEDGTPLACGKRYLGPELHSNNFAEFSGLIDLLEWADENQMMGMDIFSDSKLVVNTVLGTWKLNVPSLNPLRNLAYAWLVRGKHTLQHIKGHSGDFGNDFVDRLCNQALDEAIGERK